MRASAQLIDCASGHYAWAEKFDRNLDDNFQMQDKIVQAIAAVVAPQLDRAELQRAAEKQPADLDGWDLCMRAISLARMRTKTETAMAQALFKRAIELDPEYSDAHAGLAMPFNFGAMKDYAEDIETALQSASTVATQSDRARGFFSLGASQTQRSIPIAWSCGRCLGRSAYCRQF